MPIPKPLSKTLVTEIRVELADIYLRQKQLKESVSAKIPYDSNLRIGDHNLLVGTSLVLDNVTTALIVQCYDSFIIDLVNGQSSVTLNCTGLFTFYGKVDRAVVRIGAKKARATYLCA